MASLEFQVQEGDCGDFIALGNVYGDGPVERKIKDGDKPFYIYNPKGTVTPLKYGPEFVASQSGKSELHEKPHGQWNTLEIYCLGSESIHLVNGFVVNRVKNARYDIDGSTIPVVKGKIQLQSEAAEVYYKNIILTPINAFPSKYADF